MTTLTKPFERVIYEFDDETHTYYINGKPATGVTTVISVLAKPALIQWAANEVVRYLKENNPSTQCYDYITDEVLEAARTAHTRKKEAAGTHGTDAHALVEEYVKRCIDEKWPLPRVDSKDSPIYPFTLWAAENVDHFLFSERQMFNKELFIAGTADFGYVGKDGKRYIADFKTSSGIYGIDYWLQCAAYRMLAEADGDEPYDGCTVVRLGKKGPSDFEVHHRYDYATDKEAFLACLTIYRAQATWVKPKKTSQA